VEERPGTDGVRRRGVMRLPIGERLRSRIGALLAAVVLILAAVIPAAAASPQIRAEDANAPAGRLMVIWRDSPPSTTSISLPGVRAVRPSSTGQRSLVIARAGQAGAVAAALRADPRVLAVAPDARVHATGWPADGAPDDDLYPQQQDLSQIGVPAAWTYTTGDPSVVVAVIDSGVDLDHPDLAGVAVTAPRNETWNSTDVTDDFGHGTHVAGTIFARTNNDRGIAGIAPNSTLMPIKVLDDLGDGFLSDVLDAVDWARTHGADVINLSLGGTLEPDQVALAQPTFTAAHASGIVIVAAAGNSGDSEMLYPAGFAGVISVSAVDGGDGAADFSTFNRAVDISAPGVDTLSTTLTGYGRDSGTSMSAPHVSGVAALVLAARPGLDPDELEAVLRTSAVDLGPAGRDNHFGSGRIDAAAAMTAPVPDPLPDLEPPPLPGPLTIVFTSPTAPTRQTSRSVTVSWTTSHDVTDGIVIRLQWRLHSGRCPDLDNEIDGITFLPFVSPTVDRGLAAGACYRYEVAAIDDGGQIDDEISQPVTIVDTTRPTITSRSPASGAVRVSTKATIRVRFSEPVRGVTASSLRLKNLATGLWVRVKVTYSPSTRTATIDPVLWMFHATKYAVYATSGIRDLSGNTLAATHWSFTTAR
jgi:subtilisin family serine protease